jgi:hypothetical protein
MYLLPTTKIYRAGLLWFARIINLFLQIMPLPSGSVMRKTCSPNPILRARSEYLEAAAALCDANPRSTRGMKEEVEAAQATLRDPTFYQPVSNDELPAVIAALSRESRGVAGNWLRGPNGHPFAIRGCGGVM